jgi:paraquat-inducible protein B
MTRASPTLVGSFVLGGAALALAAVLTLGLRGRSSQLRRFVIHLTGTVNGLREGAPVKFKGIEIGTVERVAIHLVCANTDVPIVVVCSVDEKRLGAASVGAQSRPTPVPELVAAGLRARLETESLVTGLRYIGLRFTPEIEGLRLGDLDEIPEIPSVPADNEALSSGIEYVVLKLQSLDLAGLIDEAKAAAKAIGDLGRRLDAEISPLAASLSQTAEKTTALARSTDEGVAEARATLVSARKLIDDLDAAIGPFSKSVTGAAHDVGTAASDFSGTLAAIDGSAHPDAPLLVQLRTSLGEIAAAARAARSLLEHLDRDPSELLRGRSLESGASR